MKKMMKRLALLICGALSIGIMTSCGDTSDSSDTGAAAPNDKSFIITLYPEYAPLTCENFEKLVKDGFYDA